METSIVISVLEEVCGIEAYALSNHFSRGNNGNGLLLMLFILWGFVLRSMCLDFGCYETVGRIIVPASLFWVRHLIKWVAYMIYFYD